MASIQLNNWVNCGRIGCGNGQTNWRYMDEEELERTAENWKSWENDFGAGHNLHPFPFVTGQKIKLQRN